MKLLLIFVVVLGITLFAAYLLGWRNLGNQAPLVPQKLTAQMSVKPVLTQGQGAISAVQDPRADTSCARILQAVQNQATLEGEVGWLAGFIAARNADGAIAAARLEPEALRTELLAVCAEFPTETLLQVAERVIAKLRP